MPDRTVVVTGSPYDTDSHNHERGFRRSPVLPAKARLDLPRRHVAWCIFIRRHNILWSGLSQSSPRNRPSGPVLP